MSSMPVLRQGKQRLLRLVSELQKDRHHSLIRSKAYLAAGCCLPALDVLLG